MRRFHFELYRCGVVYSTPEFNTTATGCCACRHHRLCDNKIDLLWPLLAATATAAVASTGATSSMLFLPAAPALLKIDDVRK